MSGLYEQIKDDLGYLGLASAAECFAPLAEQARKEDKSHVAYLAEVIAAEASATRNRRLGARVRYARFPYRRTIEEFGFEFQPSVDRKLVDDLATLRPQCSAAASPSVPPKSSAPSTYPPPLPPSTPATPA